MVRPAFEIEQLTVGERLELIEQLWDSLRGHATNLPLGTHEREVIEARRADHRRDPSTAVPWEVVRAELASDQDADERA